MKILQLATFLILIGCSSKSPAQTVYTTKTGEKYHTASCSYLAHSKKEILLEQALNLGYHACSVCLPGANPGQIQPLVAGPTHMAPLSETSLQKTTASQCTGKTKSGTRCKRMTKNADGTCYQHFP